MGEVEIDHKALDRELLEAAHHNFGKSGRLSKANSQHLMDAFAKREEEGQNIATLENTLRFVLQSFSCTNPARAMLEEKVGAVEYKPRNGYYIHVDGQNFDRGLFELANKLSRDRHISKADAVKLWEDAMDGSRVTNIEKATLRYVMKEFDATRPAKEYLTAQIDSLDSKGKPTVVATAMRPPEVAPVDVESEAEAKGEAAAAANEAVPVEETPAPQRRTMNGHNTSTIKRAFISRLQLLTAPGSPYQKVVTAMESEDSAPIAAKTVTRALCRCVLAAAEKETRDEAMQALDDLLSRKNVDPNPPSNSQEMGPLHLAAKLNVPAAAKKLLDTGASLVSKFMGARTPLHIAQELGNQEVMDVMLTHIELLEAHNVGDTGLFAAVPSAAKRKRTTETGQKKRARRN